MNPDKKMNQSYRFYPSTLTNWVPVTISSSLSAVRLRALYLFSSDDDNSPVSSFSCWSFWSSGILHGEMNAPLGEFSRSKKIEWKFNKVYGSLFLPLHVTGLVVQSKKGHGRVNGFPALGTQPHHLQPSLVDLLCQLINGDVTGSTH